MFSAARKSIRFNFKWTFLVVISLIGTSAYLYHVSGSFSTAKKFEISTLKPSTVKADQLNFLSLFNRVTAIESKEACPDQVMVLFDKGRFGNQFLEYLATRVVSVSQQTNFYIVPDLSGLLLRYFQKPKAAVLDERKFAKDCKVTRTMWTTESLERFDENQLYGKMNYKYVKIIGYPLNITVASWRMMFQYRELLVQEFQWKEELQQKIQNKINALTEGKTFNRLVGIHVRRTDFLDHLKILYGPSKLAGKEYFQKAKDIYKQKYGNPGFLVLSEDMQWCKDNLAADDVIFAGEGDENDPGFDLALLSSFQHLILSYGTFGISAAFMSGAEVIIADNFTTRPNDLNERLKQLHLPNWLWLSVS